MFTGIVTVIVTMTIMGGMFCLFVVWPLLFGVGIIALRIAAVCFGLWAIALGIVLRVCTKKGLFERFRNDPVTWHHTAARVLRAVLIACIVLSAIGCVTAVVVHLALPAILQFPVL